MPTSHLPRLTVIFVVLLAALWAIFPSLLINPRELFDPSIPLSEKHNLKPGIDMVGGARLVYEIKPPAGRAADPGCRLWHRPRDCPDSPSSSGGRGARL